MFPHHGVIYDPGLQHLGVKIFGLDNFTIQGKERG